MAEHVAAGPRDSLEDAVAALHGHAQLEPDAAPDPRAERRTPHEQFAGAVDLVRHERAPVAARVAVRDLIFRNLEAGQFILRHLTAKLGVSAENGAAYYAGHGAETGPLWRRFGERVNALPMTDDEREECVRSAASTFTALERWFSRQGVFK